MDQPGGGFESEELRSLRWLADLVAFLTLATFGLGAALFLAPGINGFGGFAWLGALFLLMLTIITLRDIERLKEEARLAREQQEWEIRMQNLPISRGRRSVRPVPEC